MQGRDGWNSRVTELQSYRVVLQGVHQVGSNLQSLLQHSVSSDPQQKWEAKQTG